MKKRLSNQLTMHLATLVVLNQIAEKFKLFTAYPALKASLDKNIDQEQAVASDQESRIRNSTAAKNFAKNAAAEYILDLLRKVSAYAIVKGDRTLLDKVRFNTSTVNRSSDNKLVLIFETVLACAGENSDNVEEYGVTEQLLSDGSDLLDNLKAEMQNLLLSNSEQKQLTVQLQQQFKTTNAILRPIDAMVDSFRLSDPVSYRLYRNARSIKNTGGTKLSAIGKVIDAVTHLPLHKAKVSLVSQEPKALTSGADLVKNVKITGTQGGFQLKSLVTGTYLLNVTYAGYTDQQVTVYINEGILSRIEIPLTRIQPEALN